MSHTCPAWQIYIERVQGSTAASLSLYILSTHMHNIDIFMHGFILRQRQQIDVKMCVHVCVLVGRGLPTV